MKKARNKDWKIKPVNMVIRWLDKLFWRVTGRTHNYHVEIWYKGHDEAQRATSPYITGVVSLTYRHGSEQTHRAIRRYFGERMIPALNPSQLTNGKLVIHQIAYLGRY